MRHINIFRFEPKVLTFQEDISPLLASRKITLELELADFEEELDVSVTPNLEKYFCDYFEFVKIVKYKKEVIAFLSGN